MSFIHYGFITGLLVFGVSFGLFGLSQAASVTWAATSVVWQVGYAAGRYGREWPMCVMNYPAIPELFEPARAPL